MLLNVINYDIFYQEILQGIIDEEEYEIMQQLKEKKKYYKQYAQ